MNVDVAIIGGGVSGLATAYDLKRQGFRVVVLERQARAGGNAVSERIGGFLMEHGPSTVNASAREALDFSAQLGLDGMRCELGPGVRQRYLVDDGALSAISIKPLGFLMSKYLSLPGRLRVMAEIAISRPRCDDDETVAQFCNRRFGNEFTSRVIDPLVGGLYAGRADELSISAVFPALKQLEREHRSITLGMLRRRRRNGRMPGRRLFSWQNGIGSLPRALSAGLGETVRTGIVVRRIRRDRDGFSISTASSGSIQAKAIVIATQPHVAAQLLEPVDADSAVAAGAIDAPPLAVVFAGYRREQVEHPLDGLGYLSAPGEAGKLSGAQFCSTMFPGRAPDGHVAIAGYIGGARAPDLGRLPAGELTEIARQEFADLIGARGDPVVMKVRHWPLGIPQYRLGHGERIDCLSALGQRAPGLFLTGNYFRGPSVAMCLANARDTAIEIEKHLTGAERPEERHAALRDATER
ncbi:MAG: protoporphyrinogen oxidase [Alphaproteobacteria bacterium]